MTAFNFNSYILKTQTVCIDSSQFTFTNAPTTMSGLFLFIVIPAFESNALQQIVIMDSGDIMYTRSYDGSNQTFSGWITNGSAAEILATPLTGFVSTAGVPTSASTVLQAFQNLSFRSSAFIYNLAVASVSSGNQSLASSLSSLSSDITISSPVINLPLNKNFVVTARLDVTTGLTSGATFSLTAANATVVVQPIAVGASITNGYLIVAGIVTTTDTAAPTIALSASSVTGTVAINNDSTILLQQI